MYYPPWIMGITVTMSPSFTNDSLVSKSEESIPFTTIKKLSLLKSESYLDTYHTNMAQECTYPYSLLFSSVTVLDGSLPSGSEEPA